MTPQTMTVLTDHKNKTQIGNSMQACIATIFNVSLDSVPHFYDISKGGKEHIELVAFDRLRKWLEPHGLYPIEFQPKIQVAEEWFKTVEGYHIRGGGRPLMGDMHWCVAHKHDLLFDPHPEQMFINPYRLTDMEIWRVVLFGKKV